MTADERLSLIRVKIERAYQHIDDLDAALKSLKNSNVYTGESQFNPKTGYSVFRAGDILDPFKIPQLKDVILPMAGDVIHNLRSALDYLAWQLSDMTGRVDAASGTPLTDKEIRDISFPIIDTTDPDTYKAKRVRQVKAMRQDAIDKIDLIEPYEAGKGHDLWVLHKLNNIDKHRLLIAVVADLQSIEFTYKDREGRPSGFYTSLQRFSLHMNEPLSPALKSGEPLFAHIPKANENVKLCIEIAFGESGIIESKPILPTLKQLAGFIDSLILTFRDELT
jgi:hypothetical protein